MLEDLSKSVRGLNQKSEVKMKNQNSENLSQPEPSPIVNQSIPVWDLVIKDMRDRDESGMAKYGTRLQANNGRDALLDAYQESLDMAVYLRQAIEERGTGHIMNGDSFEVRVVKLATEALMQKACEFTINAKSSMTLDRIYQCEHSPIRTQIFWIELIGIPTFVSVHLVRHKIGVEHFVQSNRYDRGGAKDVDRWTPVNHAMMINAQSLINMARKRLCAKASDHTRIVMENIRSEIETVDPALARWMVRDCEYRNGCYELKSCGWWKRSQGRCE